MTNTLTTLSKAEKAIITAETVEELEEIEAWTKAAMAYAHEIEDFAALVKIWAVFWGSRSKATTLIQKEMPRTGPTKKFTVTRDSKLAEYSLSSETWERRKKEAGLGLDTVLRYLETCTKDNPPSVAGLFKFSGIHTRHASMSNEWYTPEKYIISVRKVLGTIDLDPASSKEANKIVQAKKYYDLEANGLDEKRKWEGKVFMNPPWGQEGPDFIFRLVKEFEGGAVSGAIALVNANGTETEWFQPLFNYLLCFTDHRIDYTNGEGSGSTHGSCFVYMGSNRRTFIKEFATWGNVVERAK